MRMAKFRRAFGSGFGCYLAIIILAASLSVCVPPARGDEAATRQANAGTIYYLLKFITFPDTRFDDTHAPLRVCVLGDWSLTAAISATTSGGTVGGRGVKVIRTAACEALSGCHVAVVGKHCALLATTVFGEAHRQQVLTIAVEDKLHAKSLITMQALQGQTRLRVRLEAAQRAGFQISSELLALAEIVRE